MKKLARALLGVWNARTVLAISVGAVFFGVLMNYGSIRIYANTSLTTAMIVPVMVGSMFGPVPAFIACFAGNIIADLIGGSGLWLDWSVGNAVLGFIVGLLPLYGAKIDEGIFRPVHAVIYAAVCVIGNLLAFGVITPLLTLVFYRSELAITFAQAWAASASNIGVLLLLGIPLLFILARLNATNESLESGDYQEK